MKVKIDYTNWKGNRRIREIDILSLDWCTHYQYHMVPQWLFAANDPEEPGTKKYFVINNIHRMWYDGVEISIPVMRM